jgi:choline dehydrogenase-like flavoprotein
MFVKNLVIGSGFTGRTVAAHLGDSVLILDRGERLDHSVVIARREAGEGGSAVFRSALPWNQLTRLSELCSSYYPMIVGGASNAWGGNTRRLPPSTFERTDGPIAWPLSFRDILPWYEKAELRLNLSGDPAYSGALLTNSTGGFEQWRYALRPYFDGVGLSAIAINTGSLGKFGQGICIGRSNCETCREDAKARPDNLFPEMPLLPGTQCLSIQFDGAKAISATCYNGREVFDIEFERCIIAANGIESPAILLRSELPPNVRREYIGKFIQDHTHFEIQCMGSFDLPYNTTAAFGHVYVNELAGEYSGIEVSCFALTHESPLEASSETAPNIFQVLSDSVGLTSLSQRIISFYFELEIPATEQIYVILREDGSPRIEDSAYLGFLTQYEEVRRQIICKLEERGLKVINQQCHYRGGYGGHHFAGTLNMGGGIKAVCDENARLIGTDNVYVAGTSLIPRAGGEGPTLTAVALAERLGNHLSEQDLERGD